MEALAQLPCITVMLQMLIEWLCQSCALQGTAALKSAPTGVNTIAGFRLHSKGMRIARPEGLKQVGRTAK